MLLTHDAILAKSFSVCALMFSHGTAGGGGKWRKEGSGEVMSSRGRAQQLTDNLNAYYGIKVSFLKRSGGISQSLGCLLMM